MNCGEVASFVSMKSFEKREYYCPYHGSMLWKSIKNKEIKINLFQSFTKEIKYCEMYLSSWEQLNKAKAYNQKIDEAILNMVSHESK